MLWGGRWEGGSCLGMHVRIKDFKIKKKKIPNTESPGADDFTSEFYQKFRELTSVLLKFF